MNRGIMTTSNPNQLPLDKLAIVNQLKTIIEINRDKLQQIVAESEYGEWDRESAITEAEKLKTQAIEAARLLERILRGE